MQLHSTTTLKRQKLVRSRESSSQSTDRPLHRCTGYISSSLIASSSSISAIRLLGVILCRLRPSPAARLHWAARGPDPARGGLWVCPRSLGFASTLRLTQCNSTFVNQASFVYTFRLHCTAQLTSISLGTGNPFDPFFSTLCLHRCAPWPRVKSSPSIHWLGAHSYRPPPPLPPLTRLNSSVHRTDGSVTSSEWKPTKLCFYKCFLRV